jgi:23S rRNA (cytosine1962-C5)-methyltransferase
MRPDEPDATDPESLRVRVRVRAELARAAAQRACVRAETTAYRLIDGAADGFAGVAVDCYGEWAVVSVYDASAESVVAPLGGELVRGGTRGVYVKRHTRGDPRRKERSDVAPAVPLAGEPAPPGLTVDEHGMRFGVWLDDGLSTGLFTDQRVNRQRVRALSRGARVLNLFAYTCSFTVAAALGGAVETVSVDLSNRALARGRENLDRNGIALAGHRFIREDALAFLGRAGRRGEGFGVVVLDPPSFGTSGRRTFSVERDYAELVALATRVLAPEGRLLAVTNHRKTTSVRLVQMLRDAAHTCGRRVADVQTPPPPSDYPDCRDGEPVAKSVLVAMI